jgi:hypothetical protein
MPLYIQVRADTNDADYVSSFEIIDEDDLEFIKHVGAAIKTVGQRHNWPTSKYASETFSELYVDKDLLTEEEIEDFNELYVPYGEYGVHTIASIQILDISSISEVLA